MTKTMTRNLAVPFLTAANEVTADDNEFVAARGTRIWDRAGRELLCATSGLWNTNLGYGNERVRDAVANALTEASYLTMFRSTNSWARTAAADVARAASDAGEWARVLFTTSGGSANDAVLKLVRQRAVLKGEPHRRLVVSMENSYHGLTNGAFSVTGKDLGQEMYGVDRRFSRTVPANDVTALRSLFRALGPKIAAVIVEPVMGQGAISLEAEYITALQDLAAENGALVVADEVATGFGRTGPMFASEQWPVQPDVLITSKGLTNGALAASAVLLSWRVWGPLEAAGVPVGHAETAAGSPSACAAMSAVIAEFEDHDIVARGKRVAQLLDVGLRDLQASHSLVTKLTGQGCFRGVVLSHGKDPARNEALHRVMRERGVVVHPSPYGIMLVPSLTYTDADIRLLLDTLDHALTEVGQ